MIKGRTVRCRGFTLLEALIAIIITSIVFAGAMTLLRAEITAYRHLSRSSDEIFELRLFWATLEREFRSMISYSKVPFSGQENQFCFSSVLTKYGTEHPDEVPSRIAYEYNEQGLTRREVPLRSLLSSGNESTKKIIPSLKKFIVEYAYRGPNHSGIFWEKAWEKDQGLPRGIRITLGLKPEGPSEKKERSQELLITKEFYNPQGNWGWKEKDLF